MYAANKILGGLVDVLPELYTTWAQTQSNVNGLVTDFSGEPLIGVSILVKGTSNGTVTDLDGKFSLSAEMGDMLQISYVGYISQEIKVP